MSWQEVLEAQYPAGIEPEEIWSVIDSTKMTTYMRCPREHFFSAILGWKGVEPNIHLEFGVAFHLAMEHLLHTMQEEGGYNELTVWDAHVKFMEHYRKVYPDIAGDKERAPKDPDNCLLALQQYSEQYASDDFDVLYSELCGSVHLEGDTNFYFKHDAICEGTVDGMGTGIFGLDHKTASRDTPTWRQEWEMNFQMNAYTFVMHCLFPDKPILGMVINGIVLRKMGNLCVRLPIQKTATQMNDWFWTVQYYLREMQFNFDNLAKCKEEDEIMTAFPKRTVSCIRYMRPCPFFAFCQAWGNPLQHCGNGAPPGMKKEFWDPRKQEEDSRFTIAPDTEVVEHDKGEATVQEKYDAPADTELYGEGLFS